MPRAIGLVVLVVLLLGASPGDKPPVKVQATKLDKSVVTGTLAEAKLKVRAPHIYQEIDANHVRKVTFHPPDAPDSPDTIDLIGGGHGGLRGTCENESFTIRTDAGDVTLKPGELREMKFLKSGPANWLFDIFVPLITLTAMEIILGIDNIIFLAIIAGRLPAEQQPRARRIGLLLALGSRILLLLSLSAILALTAPVFTLPALPFLSDMEAREVSWRDIILLAGGLFLIGKSTYEIHEKLEKSEADHAKASAKVSFGMVLVQIAIIDIVFSLDSVITAVGMVDSVWIMITAMLVAVVVMLVFAGIISDFVSRNPTLKILALAFLILIGVLLVAEGFGQHMDKGYIYFAMAFSLVIEVLNLRLRRKSVPVKLNTPDLPAGVA